MKDDQDLVQEISSGLSDDEWGKTDAQIKMQEGSYPVVVGALTYYKDSIMLPFTISEGGYAGRTDALYGSKQPTPTKNKKTGQDGFFWPLKNWLTALGIEADMSSGSATYTKEQLASVPGRKGVAVYKNKPYEIPDEVTGEVRKGYTPKATNLLPLTDKKVEEPVI